MWPQDWSALSDKVQWAIIYDLANDHEDGITGAANLLGLTLDDVISFVNLYVREKTLWENGAYRDEPAHPVGALFQLDGAQHEVEQPVLEAEADQIMHDFEPDRQDIGAGATQTVTDAEVGPPLLEGLQKNRHEPEFEPFHETDTQLVAETEPGLLGAEKVANQTDLQADEERCATAAWPPAVELITDSFSREDIASGRSFLTFVGLQEYADGFGQWFGTGTTFREIPGIFDENNEFIFSTEDTKKGLYSDNEFNWAGPVPRLGNGPAQREGPMEAFPRDLAQHKEPVDAPLQRFRASAERINGRSISLHAMNDAQVGISEGHDTRKRVSPSYLPPLPQLPPIFQPHESIAHPAGRTGQTFVPLGHNSIQVPSSEQASQARARESPGATPNATLTQSIEASSKPDARNMAEEGTHEAGRTMGPASSSAVNNATPPDAQGPVELGQISENCIDVDTFPKCYSCFRVRARCDGGRPCSSCIKRNRNCKSVTQAVLDEFPDRAKRVLKDAAKADGMAAQVGESGSVRETTSTLSPAFPDLTTSHLIASHTTASHTAATGAKRKLSAMAAGGSSDEDDSDLDNFPPEKDDPTDGDFGLEPKKKRPKKGNTPMGKKSKPSQAKEGVPTTPTPTKRRGPYRKKVDAATPKPNESVAGANSTPILESGGSISAGIVAEATSARKTPAKAPTAVNEKFSSPYRNAVEESLLGVGAGRSVNDTAERVRHAGGQSGMTKLRPVPVGKRNETPKLVETHNTLDPSLFSSKLSGVQHSRYLDIPFAPVATRPHTPQGGFVQGMPMPQLSRSVAGSPDAALRASPYSRAHPMPPARTQLIPPRPRTISAENGQSSSSELPKTAVSPKTPMTLQEMRSVATERMPFVPQIARPGLNGSPGATDISPTSQSSTSGTTVSMDFLNIPFTPSQEAYSSDVSVSGRIRPSSVDRPTMSGFSPDVSAGRAPMDSPTASWRRRSVPSYNIGAYNRGTNVSPPMMEADTGFAVAPGLVSPYAILEPQRPVPRPISRMQQGLDYPVPQQTMHPSRPPSVFYDRQSEEVQPGLQSRSASPGWQQHSALPHPAKRQADAPLYHSQQPARKKPRGPASPLAPPREAKSWKELARSQWVTETQENQPETANFSAQPVSSDDGSFDVSSGQFTSIHDHIDPELQ